MIVKLHCIIALHRFKRYGNVKVGVVGRVGFCKGFKLTLGWSVTNGATSLVNETGAAWADLQTQSY